MGSYDLKNFLIKELADTALLNLLHQSPASEAEVQTVEGQGTEVQTHDEIVSLHEQIRSLNTECQSPS